ncbi:MAG: ABC transporter ATP-binding protein [Nitrososphaerales archaeon]
MLEVRSLNVYYGNIQVLYDVSFKVEKNELVALIGSNAAGKTTLLDTIIGWLHPKSGSITFNGFRIDHLPPHKVVELGVSIVPEGRMLFPALTVLENLMLGAFTRSARKKIQENLEKVFEIFPALKERKQQLAGTLSGGEQQMLAIGRALMANPTLLLLDEPSQGLAPIIVTKIFSLIKELNNWVTILMVEQNAYKALKVASRVYILENGRIVREGESQELVKDDGIRKAYLGV